MLDNPMAIGYSQIAEMGLPAKEFVSQKTLEEVRS